MSGRAVGGHAVGGGALGDRTVTRVRHDLRLRLVEVVDAARVTPRRVRITLGGTQLGDFVSAGFDDHVKVFIPPAGKTFTRVPALGPGGPVFEDVLEAGATAPAMRDYTPHHHDSASATLQLDFALHDGHEAGPATVWARRARPGDALIIGGPRGSFVVGTGFDWHLLVGDDTALPAIRRRLAELPEGARAVVCAEVQGPGDEQPFDTRAMVETHWVHRSGTRGGAAGRAPSRLLEAVTTARLPAGDGYAWVGCESADAKAIRAALVSRGVDRSALRASGYWRRGAPASHDVYDDGAR